MPTRDGCQRNTAKLKLNVAKFYVKLSAGLHAARSIALERGAGLGARRLDPRFPPDSTLQKINECVFSSSPGKKTSLPEDRFQVALTRSRALTSAGAEPALPAVAGGAMLRSAARRALGRLCAHTAPSVARQDAPRPLLAAALALAQARWRLRERRRPHSRRRRRSAPSACSTPACFTPRRPRNPGERGGERRPLHPPPPLLLTSRPQRRRAGRRRPGRAPRRVPGGPVRARRR